LAKTTLLSKSVDYCIKDIESCVDTRHIAFEIEPEISQKEIILNGLVHFSQQETALVNSIKNISQVKKNKMAVVSNLKILSGMNLRFAQVNVQWADLRIEPKKKGEMCSQLCFGSYVLCYFSKGRYFYCSGPDGYLGYIHKEDIIEKDRDGYVRWMNGSRCRLLKEVISGDLVLPLGAELGCIQKHRVILPDATRLRLSNQYLFTYSPAENEKAEPIIEMARKYLGVPYLWGGRSFLGIDCSGYTQMIYMMHNIAIPRDASQQIYVGRLMGMLGDFSDFLPGDLLFFMGKESKIVHVGISTGGERFLHATLKEGIKESHIDDDDFCGTNFRDIYIMGRRLLI
jgi:gamma-D-glutamyl-L-lysine dipeptidyl-peptidase